MMVLIMFITSLTAALSFVVLAAALKALRQLAGAVVAGETGVHRSASVLPAGRPAAVETMRSVNGVILTVCPTDVAIDVSTTCLPPDVPVMLSMKGAVMPATSTVNAPVALVVAAGDISVSYTHLTLPTSDLA